VPHILANQNILCCGRVLQLIPMLFMPRRMQKKNTKLKNSKKATKKKPLWPFDNDPVKVYESYLLSKDTLREEMPIIVQGIGSNTI